MRVNGTLTSLDLGYNGIVDAGATQLAECLRVNATLTSLDLCECEFCATDIGDAGAMQLAECLRVNATLVSIDLGSNEIGDAGATLLLAENLHCMLTLRSRAWTWATTASSATRHGMLLKRHVRRSARFACDTTDDATSCRLVA